VPPGTPKSCPAKDKKTPLRVAHDAISRLFESLNGFEVIENEIKAGEEESHPSN
jgi:hypothetical protein